MIEAIILAGVLLVCAVLGEMALRRGRVLRIDEGLYEHEVVGDGAWQMPHVPRAASALIRDHDEPMGM